MRLVHCICCCALCATAACAGPQPAATTAASSSPAAALAGTRWVARDAAGTTGQNSPRLEFVGEGRLAGYTGCNMLSGTWRNEGGEVRFGPIVTTKRACMGPEGESERRLMGALGERSRAHREGAKLVIEGPDGARFEFSDVPGT